MQNRVRSLNLLPLSVAACAVMWLGCSATPPSHSEASRGRSSDAASGSNIGTANTAAGASSLLPSPAGRSAGVKGAETCASALVQISKNMPSVVFVIDGSGSMCAPYGDGTSTRWQALRSALLDPTAGFIYRLQSSVRFGATLYDGSIDSNLSTLDPLSVVQNPACALLYAAFKGGQGMCPQLLAAMPPKLDNARAVDMVFPATELGGSTPTDRALQHVMDELLASRQQQSPDDPAQGDVYVILATDGAPNDICVNGVGGDGSLQRQGVITAVDRGAAAGIKTWVISLANGDPALQAHLDEVARHGDPKNATAHTFSPTNPEELIKTLAQLLGGAVGCHIALNGTVKSGQECLGSVENNSARLPCCTQTAPGTFSCDGATTTAPNGWRLTDPHSIELLGDSCAGFLLGQGSLLHATFPCQVFTPD